MHQLKLNLRTTGLWWYNRYIWCGDRLIGFRFNTSNTEIHYRKRHVSVEKINQMGET
jgi:hypothetical protein